MQTISAKTVILRDISGNYLLPYVEPTPLVTTTSDGLMSKEDKIKLDNMSEGGGGSGTGGTNINDSTTSTTSTWSSTKINTELDKKLDPSNIIAGNNVIISRDGKNLTISAIGGGSSSGEGFADPTILQNYYTKVETDNKYALKASEHTHANKELLDNFTVDTGGILRYNGNIIPVNPSELTSIIEGEYSTETEIFNILKLCTDNHYKALINNYVLINNIAEVTTNLVEDEKDPNVLSVSVYSGNIRLDTIEINPQCVQGYQLPAITNLKIKAKGKVHSELTLVGYNY